MQDLTGSFFGLELPEYRNFPHPESLYCAWLNSGRAAFECLLRSMPRPENLWIPRFICDTVLQAPARLGIPVKRYSCTAQLEPILPEAGERDIVLLVNYFGLTDSAISTTAAALKDRCIVDATTALYSPPPHGVPTFYSPRKFCGVADGGVALAPELPLWIPPAKDNSSRKSLVLLERIENGAEAAMTASETAEAALDGAPLRMSNLTRRLLTSIDFETAAKQRLENYNILHQALKNINRLNLPETPLNAPMCYPLVSGIPGLRDTLIDAGIALPLYWPEVIEQTDAGDVENRLARQLLPLPLDQRYSKNTMERIIDLILA